MIKSSSFISASSKLVQCPKDGKNEYAFIGRSNVGKSSLINYLCSKKNMALTSSKPGKTRSINHFLINEKWYMVDLPGYGYASASKENKLVWDKFTMDYLLKRETLICVFVLIDSRLEPQKIDLEFMEMLGENQVPFVIAFTKADKNKKQELQRNIDGFLSAMGETWETLPPHFITSSVENVGRDEIVKFIEKTNKELK